MTWELEKNIDKQFVEVWGQIYDLQKQIQMLREQIYALAHPKTAVDDDAVAP